jgi:hypothetical protein
MKLEEKWAIKEMASLKSIEILEREKQRNARNVAIKIQLENQAMAHQDRQKYLNS